MEGGKDYDGRKKRNGIQIVEKIDKVILVKRSNERQKDMGWVKRD